MPSVGGPDTRIINSRWRTAAILEKSLYLCCHSSDFDIIWHSGAVRPSWPFSPLKIWNFKNPRWRHRHLQKSKTDISPPWFELFRQNLVQWRSSSFLTVPIVKNIKFLKFKMVAAAILNNQNRYISTTVWPISTIFGMVTQFDIMMRPTDRNL